MEILFMPGRDLLGRAGPESRPGGETGLPGGTVPEDHAAIGGKNAGRHADHAQLSEQDGGRGSDPLSGAENGPGGYGI